MNNFGMFIILEKMLSKSKSKMIRSLVLKKNRMAENLFVAEGRKLVFDLVESSLSVSEVFCTKELAVGLSHIANCPITEVSKEELEKISSFKSTPDIIALFNIPEKILNWNEITKDLTFVIDSVQDPGNLGTIVRLGDWFGIKNIICSEDCADLYNPKTIQATMGAVARVNVHYLSLKDFLQETKKHSIPVYGTFMEGENLYSTGLSANGIIVMGNEGKGISKEIEAFISKKISIPRYPIAGKGLESLNVAIAASIVCAEFRRRIIESER